MKLSVASIFLEERYIQGLEIRNDTYEHWDYLSCSDVLSNAGENVDSILRRHPIHSILRCQQ